MKIFRLLLVGLLSFSLLACEANIDVVSVYGDAKAAMDALSSYTIEANTIIEAQNEDETTVITSSMTYMIKDQGKDTEAAYKAIKNDVSGTDIKTWQSEGVLYIQDGDTKYQEEGALDKFDMDFSGIITAENTKGSVQDEVTILNMRDVGVKDIIIQFLDSDISLYQDLILADTADVTFKIDKDDHITSIIFITTADIEGVGTVALDMTLNISAFNATDIPALEKEGFIDPDTANDSIYADRDLTKNDVAVLESNGYTLQDDGTYYNGTYHINISYKQLYTDNIVYDWEYDQGYVVDDSYSITCAYNFIDDTSEGECDKETISALRDAYNALVSSIEG